MASDDLDIGNKALSAEERMANLIALGRGLTFAVDGFCHRVDTYGALLEEEVEDRPAAVGYVRQCREAAARASAWLDAFRQAVQPDVEFEPLDVRRVLDATAKSCRRVLAPDCNLELVAPEDEVLVEGSLFQLQDLFRVAIAGAGRHGCLPGAPHTVRVHAGVQTLGEPFFRLLRSRCADGLYFVTTIGVDAAPFEPEGQSSFWDVFLDEKGPSGAMGIACLQVYGLVYGHHGEVTIRLQPDGRRAVSILLPVRGRIKDMQAPHNLDDAQLRGTETILLVDDEDMIWDVILDMLQELGYTVILAANGREALEVYRANPGQIHLVLLDMVMPEMDGLQAFRELRKIDPAAKVLLSSGYVSEEAARSALDAGAAGFLRKPYRMVDLARRVRAILSGPTAPAEPPAG